MAGYRIMFAKTKASDYASLYQFMTVNVNGTVAPYEYTTKADLDTAIEKMLNEDGYSKNDFIVVQVVDYTIGAGDYTDEETNETAAEDTSTDDSDSGGDAPIAPPVDG